jgi:CheY-like chemotaxis protein
VSERRPSKGQPVASAPRVTAAPPELFGALVSSEPIKAAKPVAMPVESPPEPPVEELSDEDLIEEIEELEVLDAPAGPPSVIPVALPANPSLPPAPISKHKDTEAKVVLVVEDDASIRAMIVRGLGLTYTVFEADDGITATHVLARIPAPACIISDWMMPRMDGVTLLKTIRADKDMKRIPLLLLTAKNAPMEVLEGINAGARAYIAKPFKMKELIDKVSTLVSGKK